MQLSDYHSWISTLCIMYWSTWIQWTTVGLSMPACVDIWCNNRQIQLSVCFFCISTICKSDDRHWLIDRHIVKRLSMYARVDTLSNNRQMQLSDYHCCISTICIMYWSTWIQWSTVGLSMPACVDIRCNNRQIQLSVCFFYISTICKSSDRHWFIDRHIVKRLSMYARVDTLRNNW